MGDFNNTIKKIVENYENLEKSIVSQLLISTPDHGLTTGNSREDIWRLLFEQIIPRKFSIEQGVFIIDSYGNISKEVDLALYDEDYTPYIFNYGIIKFIPIEAVTAVIQCKSSSPNHSKIEEWVKSIDNLKTSTNSVARIVSGILRNKIDFEEEIDKIESNRDGKDIKKEIDELIKNEMIKNNIQKSQTSTRPIKILCYTDFGFNNKYSKSSKNMFDFVLGINENRNLVKDVVGEDTLAVWNKKLNHSKKELGKVYAKVENNEMKLSDLEITKENRTQTIMSLIFQLNQLLMIINNPMLFPHKAYVDMFDRVINGNKG